jgi:hypothetical protein
VRRFRPRFAFPPFALALLVACGGGGGGDGGSGQNDDPRVAFSANSVTASGTPGDLAPEETITFSVSNNPPDLLYIGLDHSTSGIEHVEWEQAGPAQGSIKVVFREPGSLLNGTYTDSIEVSVCLDNLCRQHVNGSPETLTASLVVSGEGPATATLSQTEFQLQADQRETGQRRAELTAAIANLPPARMWVQNSSTTNAIDFLAEGAVTASTHMTIGFKVANELGVGTYHDTVTVRLCYADNCVRQVPGSPFTVNTTLAITLGLEPGYEALPILSRTPLRHDILDAEYSAGLNAIVMTATYPGNAIYVYDLDTGVEREQALAKAPTSLSVAPDGLTAAVGHDAFVSVIDLAGIEAGGSPAPVVLNVSIPVHGVALDGQGHVFAVPRSEDGDNIHAIDIATNVEQQTPGYVERIRVQPGSQFLYGTSDIVSSDLRKWDVSSGVASYLYAWPYFNERSVCREFWFNEPGDRIYAACGEVFTADADSAQDLQLAGTMALTEPVSDSENQIRALSHSAARQEIAIVESMFFDCEIGPLYSPCFTRFATFDDATLVRTSIYGIGSLRTGGTDYAQRGVYVFHDAASGRRILIGELEGPPGEDSRFWLEVVDLP